jgi:hypothetical protein
MIFTENKYSSSCAERWGGKRKILIRNYRISNFSIKEICWQNPRVVKNRV